MSTTWTTTGQTAKAVCTTGNESAPSAATEGLALYSTQTFSRLKGFSVSAAADSGQTLSGSGSLQAYIYDDQAAAWVRVPDLDLSVTVSGGRYQGWMGYEVMAGRVNARIAFVPVSVGLSAGGITIFLNGD